MSLGAIQDRSDLDISESHHGQESVRSRVFEADLVIGAANLRIRYGPIRECVVMVELTKILVNLEQRSPMILPERDEKLLVTAAGSINQLGRVACGVILLGASSVFSPDELGPLA
jgi:hypothetical protein